MSYSGRVPVGMAEFDNLIAELRELLSPILPALDTDSIRFVVANTLLRLGPTQVNVSMSEFYDTIIAAASKQVASQVFQDVKAKQADTAAKAAQTPDEPQV